MSTGGTKTERRICKICKKEFVGDVKSCPEHGGELIPSSQFLDKLVGTIFAERYEILSIAGQGGMSTVYKARHTYMERTVAVKLLHPHLVSDPASIQRFQQESKAASSLSHPNVITVFDFGVCEGMAYLVMDYLDGPTVGDLIDQGGAVPEREALDIFRQVLRGLAHAHSKGVIHRDLKPRNLVLKVEEDGSVLLKIVDFGIAKILPQDGEASQHLTLTGEVFGSPIYMSPEQCSGQRLDKRADFYSLGCVMYEVLTGLPPLVGTNAVETMSMHVNDNVPTFRESAPEVRVTERTENVVLKCLQKKVKQRYKAAVDILEALPPDTEVPEIEEQTSTVAHRLNDIVSAGTHAGIRTPSSRKIGRRKRQFWKISSKTVAIILGGMLLGIAFFSAFYPGPKEDIGTPIEKCTWWLEMSLADLLMDKQAYPPAIAVLEDAFYRASQMGEGGIASRNASKMIETQTKLVLAYNGVGNSEKQEESLETIIQLDGERWDQRASEIMSDLGDTDAMIDNLMAKNKPVQEHLSDPSMNWAGGTFMIVEVARRLDARKKYVMEGNLLDKAEHVFARLYGESYVGLASLMMQHAECFRNQDRSEEIEKNKYYPRILAIQENFARTSMGISGNRPLTDAEAAKAPDYIRALLKDGQWLRDRSRFEGPEGAGHYLELAIGYAEDCKLIKPDELAEFYMSYADYLEQINNPQQAAKFRDKAAQVRASVKISKQ